ncbi:PadR family transcriptional regulator [Micromonospora terminaliae]|uniref:PadR family transcriptional regulator n=1 Tax=Micromonospora terminaliae TaxID=1914461 RepID=A0AAJ3DMG5_9ACTN|nr:PadR family transcriptional regulator [Micromonospora terminaliae]NES29195.1 PadR family transcriptional regulator [Micromonospora terminaliae]QGL48812.1 PadR family transcriptional regulator [Micromonospora terminaliae]
MELTANELTVLGLVIERPQHGYDLEQVIEQRGIRQWTDIGFSSIYYLLAKLETRGLLHVPHAPAAAKSRRVFHATARGREVAARTTLTLIAEARPVPHPLLVGLANLPLLSPREYAQALRSRLAQVEARLAAVEAAQQSPVPLPLAAREVFSYSLSLLHAERQWLTTRAEVLDDEQD